MFAECQHFLFVTNVAMPVARLEQLTAQQLLGSTGLTTARLPGVGRASQDEARIGDSLLAVATRAAVVAVLFCSSAEWVAHRMTKSMYI